MRRRPARLSVTLTGLLALSAGMATGAPALASSARTAALPAVAAAAAAASSPAAAAAQSTELVTRTAYRNPVSKPFADTFADPSVIRGKDGWWYAYGTSDPLREGEGTAHRIPIARSRDLVSWTHVGDAFSDSTLPSWATPDAGIWGPDIRYVDGQYRMYYVVTQTTVTDEPNDNAIGMATAPTPAGPWTDSGSPVVGPRRGGVVGDGNFKWTFDPAVVTDTDGSQWMFYGSYYGGVFVTKLTADGRHSVGDPTMVGIDNKFEGAYAVRHGGYWYLFASTANCCAGPTTGYSVQVGRSRSIAGPYVDKQGVPLVQSRAGGTPVLNQNGNTWIGAGHNAIATDLAGQEWIVYHAIDRLDPYLDEVGGINQRPMLMDRLDWIGGWPAVRGGRGPSDFRQPGPATGGRWATGFGDGIPQTWATSGDWGTATDPQSGRFALSSSAGALLTGSTAAPTAQGTRVEADERSSGAAYGLQVGAGGSVVSVVVDPGSGTVRLRESRGGHAVATRGSALPSGFDAAVWHSLSLQVRGGVAVASLTNARLGDPLATLTLPLTGPRSGLAGSGALAAGAGIGVDNLSVLPAAAPLTRLVSEHVPDQLDRTASDEFDGSALSPGWTWVREDTAATVSGGALTWPTEAADLTGTSNNAGVLLRDPGSGPWTIKTKVTLDTGTDEIRNFQQAGLIAYVNDDLFTRFDNVAIWNTRQTEFGKEMPYAGLPDNLSYGGTIVGPPDLTTWLRLTHRVDPSNGEHELRAWSSRDGNTWVKGGVWTLPAGSQLRVGLVSHGGSGATAQFDYFRLYRD